MMHEDDDAVTITQGEIPAAPVQAEERKANPTVKERRGYLGGSDAAIILGISKWSTPYQLWMEKTGQAESKDLSDNERVYWGNIHEETIAREYMKRTGRKVRKVNRAIFHPEYPFIGGHIDRQVVGEPRIVECKTTDAVFRKDWEAGVPDYYLPQVMHYMGITGAQYCDVAVLIGGNDFKIHTVERDDIEIRKLFEIEKDFWAKVQNMEAPVASTSDEADAAYRNPQPGDKFADAAVAQSIRELQRIKADMKAMEAEAKAKELEIKNFLGNDGDTIVFNDQVLATWKTVEKSSVDTKAFEKDHPGAFDAYRKTSSYRQLLLKGEK